MSLPVGVPRRAFSYDEGLEDTAPMTPPPADLCANVLWKQPVIPERKYQELSKVQDGRLLRWPWQPSRCRWRGTALGEMPPPSAAEPRRRWGQEPGFAVCLCYGSTAVRLGWACLGSPLSTGGVYGLKAVR